MEKSVMVTVGIPVYNGEKFLAQAIQSVLNQTFTDFELIITDDGSTDNSPEIARSFTDPRMVILSDGLHKGISFRLNQQISLAKGKYFARMDADDISFPERLSGQIKVLETDLQPDLVDSPVVIINEDNVLTGYRSMETRLSETLRVFDLAQFIHPTIVFRKDFIDKYLYNSKFDGAEDRDLWIRCHETARVGKTEVPLYFYREQDKLNLKSYLFRNSQLLKLLHEHKGKLSMPEYFCLATKNRARRYIFTMAFFFKLDRWLVKRRNRSLSPEEICRYSDKLNAALRNE